MRRPMARSFEHQSRNLRRGILFCFVLLFLYSMMWQWTGNGPRVPVFQSDGSEASILSLFPNAIMQKQFNLTKGQLRERDEEWRERLTDREIIAIIDIGKKGDAIKYIFVLDGGYIAMGKPVEENLIFFPHWVFGTFHGRMEDYFIASRLNELYQGWAEICAVGLDRLLGWYKKQTVIGRYLDSKLLYYNDYTLRGRILYYLPSHKVPIAMHSWVTGIHSNPPNMWIRKYLERKVLSGTQEERECALRFSDVLLFDFLIDDHDRLGSHNWRASVDGILLSWDSGLAWPHGPYHENRAILCGLNVITSATCEPICAFRNATISHLRAMGPGASEEKRIGNQLRELLSSDLLSFLFEYGVYEIKPLQGYTSWLHYKTGRFSKEDFYEGMNVRLLSFLLHVDHCIERYGYQNVLL